jgi:hypothetical protein
MTVKPGRGFHPDSPFRRGSLNFSGRDMRNPAWNAQFPAQPAYTGGVAQTFLRRPDSMLHVKSAQNQPPFPGKGRQSRQHCRRIRATGNRREKAGSPGPVSQGGKRLPLKKTKPGTHKIHHILSR